MSAPEARDDLFVGRYRLIRELGRGGMGTVDLALQMDMGREVALKRMRPESVGHVAAEAWFKREYQALAAIRHRGVPTVYDCGRSDDRIAYFTMEHIEGPSLADALKTRRFGPVEAITTAIELARILAAAHAAGVVHRDVKPANIVLEAGGFVRLVDFGICFFLSKLKSRRNLRSVGEREFETGPLEIAGSVGYTDPAIMHGEYSPSVQSDIFSVCAVLYEMLTGRRLYDDRALAFRAIDSGELAPELACAVLEIRRGSQPLPRDRHTSMDELVRGLEIARSTVQRAESAATIRRSRALFLGLNVANLGVLVTLATLWVTGRIRTIEAVETATATHAVEPAADAVEAAVVAPATVATPAAVEPAPLERPPATVAPPAVRRTAPRKQAVADDMRPLSQELVSELAAAELDALRKCLQSDTMTLELRVEAGLARLLRVEWEDYAPKNNVHGCFSRVIATIAWPRRGPPGPYHVTVRK